MPRNTTGSQDSEIIKAEESDGHIRNLIDIINYLDSEITQKDSKILELEEEISKLNK